MIFTKKQLSFLTLFNSCSNTKDFKANKLYIKSVEDKIYFALYSSDVKLVSILDKTNDEVFEKIYDINSIANIIQKCNDDEQINITENSITFGNNSEYKFEETNIDMDDPVKYLEIVNNKYEKEYIITNLELLRFVKSFISNNDAYNTISLQNNHFVTYNETVIAMTETNNDINETIYFPAIIMPIISYIEKYYNDNSTKYDYSMNIKKLQGGEFYSVYFDNVHIFLEIKNYELPYIFEEQIQEKFVHETKAIVDKNEFKNSLSRIEFLARNNIENRIYLVFEKGQIRIESRDVQKGYEIINAEVDNELEGFFIIVSAVYLKNILFNLTGDKIFVRTTNNSDVSTVYITDENEMQSYIHQLYVNIEYKN